MTFVAGRSRGGGPPEPAEAVYRHVPRLAPSTRPCRGPLCASSEARRASQRPPGVPYPSGDPQRPSETLLAPPFRGLWPETVGFEGSGAFSSTGRGRQARSARPQRRTDRPREGSGRSRPRGRRPSLRSLIRRPLDAANADCSLRDTPARHGMRTAPVSRSTSPARRRRRPPYIVRSRAGA